MIDTDKIENMKQWTNDYKVRMFWDLVTEVKRLREWENRIHTYFGDEEMMDFYDWIKEKYGEEE